MTIQKYLVNKTQLKKCGVTLVMVFRIKSKLLIKDKRTYWMRIRSMKKSGGVKKRIKEKSKCEKIASDSLTRSRFLAKIALVQLIKALR